MSPRFGPPACGRPLERGWAPSQRSAATTNCASLKPASRKVAKANYRARDLNRAVEKEPGLGTHSLDARGGTALFSLAVEWTAFKSANFPPFQASGFATAFLFRVAVQFARLCRRFQKVQRSAVRSDVHPDAEAQGH